MGGGDGAVQLTTYNSQLTTDDSGIGIGRDGVRWATTTNNLQLTTYNLLHGSFHDKAFYL